MSNMNSIEYVKRQIHAKGQEELGVFVEDYLLFTTPEIDVPGSEEKFEKLYSG